MHRVNGQFGNWLFTGPKYAGAKTEEMAWGWTRAMMSGGNIDWMGIDTNYKMYKKQADEYYRKGQ